MLLCLIAVAVAAAAEMAALSDTPTPPQTMLAVPQVTIKLEQGVLHEESGGYGNTSAGVKSLGNPYMLSQSSHPHVTEDRINDLSIGVRIKNEPALDIDDSFGNMNSMSSFNGANNSPAMSPMTPLRLSTDSPTIRMIQTTKLLPTPNAANPKRRYECPYENCTKSYGKSSHLRSHLTWHTGIKPFVCQEPGCGKGFTRSDELNRHVRTHTGEKPFECVQCNKKFSRSDHLSKHLATHSKQMGGVILHTPPSKRAKLDNGTLAPATPTITAKAPSSPEGKSLEFNDSMHYMTGLIPKTEPKEVENSEKVEANTEAPKTPEIITPENEAGKTFEGVTKDVCIKEETIDFSYQNHRKETPIIPAVQTGPLYFPQFKSEPQFEEGNDDDDRNVNDDEAEDEPDDDAIMPEANLPPLPLDIIEAARKIIRAHETLPLSSHFKGPGLAVGPHNKDSMSPMYDPARPFACSQCSKNFKRLDDLNRHIRTHTGEKPFACNECEKRFMRSDHLKKHLNTHTRIR